MKTIYKYPLVIDDAQDVYMPENAELLAVQVQYGTPCLWALVETDAPTTNRKILIRGTGHPSEGLGRYISTFQMEGGALVFHAFDGNQ